MATPVVSAGNVGSLNHLAPHIRYCAEDLYREPWTLQERVTVDYEFIYITEGTGEFTLDATSQVCGPGSLILLKPNVAHSAISLTHPFSFLCIHFDLYVGGQAGEGCEALRLYHEMPPPRTVSYSKAVLDFPDILNVSDPCYIGILMKKIVGEARREERGFVTLAKAYFLQMVMSLFREICGEGAPAPCCSPEVASAISFIRLHFGRRILLTELAQHVHLQPTYLSGVFRKQTGLSVTEYIMRCRIAAAKELLLESDEKLENIASTTGFCDIHHFMKIFKRLEGLTPTQYRQLAKR